MRARLNDTRRTQSYTWNVRNQLVGGSSGVTRTYDPLGNRTSMTANGTTTNYVVDPVGGSMPRVLWSQRGSEERVFYVYAGDTLLYQFTETGNVAHYYHFDHIGSTVALSNAGGAVTDRFAYSTYGREIGRTGTTETSFRFCGAHGVSTDPDGLVHMRARYYHPGLGRFLSEDPIQFEGGTNWYAYAEGNPAMFVDPSGNFSVAYMASFGLGATAGVVSGVRSGNSSPAQIANNALGGGATAVVASHLGSEAGFRLWAANDHYRNGNKAPVSVNAADYDFSNVNPNKFDPQSGKQNYTFPKTSVGDFVVNGTVTLQKSQSGNAFSVLPDTYNFEMHRWQPRTVVRNIETIIAGALADPFRVGDGAYQINFSGSVPMRNNSTNTRK